MYDLTRASSEQAAVSVGGEQKDRKITELEAKVLRLDEKRKALEQQCRWVFHHLSCLPHPTSNIYPTPSLISTPPHL